MRAHATKRDARSYISRFGDVSADESKKKFAQKLLHDSKKKSDDFRSHATMIELHDTLRLAIIKMRDIDSIDNGRLLEIGRTIVRLSRLGLKPIVVIDPRSDDEMAKSNSSRTATASAMKRLDTIADRMVNAISGTLHLDVGKNHSDDDAAMITRNRAKVHAVKGSFSIDATSLKLAWKLPDLVLLPVTLDIVPVLIPSAFDENNSKIELVSADDVVSLITEQLAGISDLNLIAVEKIIYIDPLGGIPSLERNSGAHVLVNLEQEYQDIVYELNNYPSSHIKTEMLREIHLSNLSIFQRLLPLLPPSSAGLVTTPEVAASPSTRNPLIYNLLTDRPVLSSSLPLDGKRTHEIQTTLLRRGIPVAIFYSEEGMTLLQNAIKSDGALPLETKNGKFEVSGSTDVISIKRLVELIEDSFGKKLDVNKYLKRVNGNIAGLVIAGDYDGAAIITWERPPYDSDGIRIAYLDKFAVSRKFQGAAGVADIIFKAMVTQLFPEEIVWRSRSENPVNKWYFDRSKGSLKLPGQKWTMFWAGANANQEENLKHYVDICTKIESSWET